MFFTTRGLMAAASAASLALASPLSPAVVERHLVGGDGVDANANLLKDGKVVEARVDIDLTLLDEPLVVVAAADVAATIPNVLDLDTEVDLGLAVICNDCGVHGSVDLTIGVDKPLPYLEVSIKDFHTKLDLEVDLYAGAYIALELFKPDQVIELNLPGLLDVKAMVYLDLILSAELPISASLGAEVSLGKEFKITTNLFEEAPIQADVDGTFVKLLPITVNVGCAKVEAFLRLRVAAIVGLDLKLNELLPILPDVGAGVALAVVADVVNVKLDLCDTPSCPVSSESWGIDVGVALDLDVALNDVTLLSLGPTIMVEVLEIPTKNNCEHGPRPTGGNGNGNGGGNGGDNNGPSATATATRTGPGNGSGSGSGNGSDNGASPSATASASGPGNGAGAGNGGDPYSNMPKPTGSNGNGNNGNGNGNNGSGNGNNNGGNGSGNGNNGGSGSGSASISATKATDAVTNGPQQTYTFVACPNCDAGSQTTVTVTGPAEVPKHPQPTEAVTTSVIDSTIMVPCNRTTVVTPPTPAPVKPTGYAAQPKPTGYATKQQKARDGYSVAPQPEQPKQPEQPAQPTGSYPSQPKQPAQPEQPKETVSSQSPPAPSTPAQPEQPGYPTKPTQPEQPEQPKQPEQPTGAYPAQPQQPKETVSSQSPPAPSTPAQPEQPGYPAQPFSNSTVPASGVVSSTMSKPVAPYPVSTPAGATATYPAGAAQPTTMQSAPSPSGGYPVQTPVVTAGAAKVGSGFLAIAAAAVAFL